MNFGLGYSEIAVIVVIALIIIGPRRLPELMRTFGKAVGQLRRMSDELRRELLFSDDIRSLRDTVTGAINPVSPVTGPGPVPPRLKTKNPEPAGAEVPPEPAPDPPPEGSAG